MVRILPHWPRSLVALLILGTRIVIAATVTDLGSFLPIGLNGDGSVLVGNIVDPNDDAIRPHAGRWSNGTLRALPERAGTTESTAVAVSDTGRAVGVEVVGTGGSADVHAIYWDGLAPPIQIGPIVAGATTDFTQAFDVDAAGNVVGTTAALVEGAVHLGTGFYAAAGANPVPGITNLSILPIAIFLSV